MYLLHHNYLFCDDRCLCCTANIIHYYTILSLFLFMHLSFDLWLLIKHNVLIKPHKTLTSNSSENLVVTASEPWVEWEVQLKPSHLFGTPNWFGAESLRVEVALQLPLRQPPAKSCCFPSLPVCGAGKIISWRNTVGPLTSFWWTHCVYWFGALVWVSAQWNNEGRRSNRTPLTEIHTHTHVPVLKTEDAENWWQPSQGFSDLWWNHDPLK